MKKKTAARLHRSAAKPKKKKTVGSRVNAGAKAVPAPPKRPSLMDDPRFAQAVQNYEAGLKAMQGRKFERAKTIAVERLGETSSTKVTLPFVEEQVRAARELMGQDYWSYGVARNRKQLEYFLAQHHKQGLSSRLVKVEELFHPTTFETYKL